MVSNKFFIVTVIILSSMLIFAACSSESKPSKEEVSNGLYELLIEQEAFSNLGDENVRVFTECVSDQVHDESSARQLNAIVDSESIEVISDEELFDEEAEKRFGTAFSDCQQQLSSKLVPQSNSSFTQ